jgi:uncharacterized protein YfaP (DUF2135 family)
MKRLNIVLISIYVALIALLLFQCSTYQKPLAEPTIIVPPRPEPAPEPEQIRTYPTPPQEIGGTGDLKITLLWDFFADIDLHVTEPDGTHLYFDHKRNPISSGFLDVDNRMGGVDAAENIFWQHAPRGRYTVRLHYFSPSILNSRSDSGVATVYIFYRGEQRTYQVPMTQVGQDATVITFEI